MSSGSSSKIKHASAAAREGGMVIVRVGEDGTDYQVHRASLKEHSEYFQKALNGRWKEADEGVVRLEDVTCSTFDVFVDWVYTGKLFVGGLDWEDWKDLNKEDFTDAAMEHALIPLCAFLYRILASGFRKAVEHAIVDYWLGLTVSQPLYSTVISAFASFPSKSPVLRLLVDTHCEAFTEESDDDGQEKELRTQLPNEFLVHVMLRYSDMLKERQYQELNACDYHDHQTEAERDECEK